MHAVKFLEQEHNRIRKMFAAIESAAKDSTRRTKFLELGADLSRHEKMEQKVWYPFLRKNAEVSSVITHLVTEEKSAAKKITALKKVKDPDSWLEKFLELKDAVEHHAEEEETKLFPKVEKQVEASDLDTVGTRMRAFKKKLDA